MRACGRQNRWPFAPAHSSNDAIEAACPMQSVEIGLLMYYSTARIRLAPPSSHHRDGDFASSGCSMVVGSV